MRRRRSLFAVCFFVAMLGHALPAHADAAADAKERFDEGARAFADRRYAEAAEAYERAAALSPHPAPLVNAAEAWTLDGNLVRAARACDEALRLSLTPALRTSIQQRLARLEGMVGTLEIDGDRALAVRIDDGGEITPPARVRLSPGTHSIAVLDRTRIATPAQQVHLAAGDHRHIMLATASTGEGGSTVTAVRPRGEAKDTAGAPRPPLAAPSRAGPPLGTWIGLGVAVAAAGAAVTFGVLTAGAKDDFDARPSSENADTFERNRLLTNVSVGVSAAALVTAAAFWLFAPRSATSGSSGAGSGVRAKAGGAAGLVITFD